MATPDRDLPIDTEEYDQQIGCLENFIQIGMLQVKPDLLAPPTKCINLSHLNHSKKLFLLDMDETLSTPQR
jgi:hypothetical protein